MDNAVLPSTLLLTLLLSVGLFFFIRASTKDRTEKAQLVSELDEASLMPQLQEYFRTRSYRVAAVDPEKNQVIFEGFVKPSWFLAAFLTLLAAVGLACLSLVVSLLFPSFGAFSLGIVLLAPLSGLFYWKKAGRIEKVALKLEKNPDQHNSSSKITVIAHRDELMELERALQLKISE
ncbi:cofactor assembly of complex C subunit B [Fortiea contorta]|uniref:cofactor assembly of complex C subunit B n=1 Tax=Fortiea contorta TaxID=1892405 RepID=UPI0003465005|nr:cofactor assembly of complex C subunit B [Fortiea contorta]